MRRWAARAIVVLTALGLLPGVVPAVAHADTEQVSITTVPPVPDFPVTVDGTTVRTDATGGALVPVRDRGNLPDRVARNEIYMKVDDANARVVITRVGNRGGQIQLGLDLFWLVSFDYATVNGDAVDIEKIGEIHVKSSIGEERTLPPDEPVWLQGSRASAGWVNKPIVWTVQEVEYAGSNVVNASQQRFEPRRVQTVPVQLLFFRARFVVRDALFGFPLGSSLRLTYPDGSARTLRLDDDAELVLPAERATG